VFLCALSGQFPLRAQLGERVEEHRELVPGDERVAVRRAADELEADAVGVGEEGRVVVGVVLRVVLRRGGVDAELAQRRGGRIDVGRRRHLQADVVQAGRIWIVRRHRVCRTQGDLQRAIEVVRVRFAGDDLVAFAKAEALHDGIVEPLGRGMSDTVEIEVVEADDVHAGYFAQRRPPVEARAFHVRVRRPAPLSHRVHGCPAASRARCSARRRRRASRCATA
jgi:hypothetical protein